MILHLHGLNVLLAGCPEHVHDDGELVPRVLPLQERSQEAEFSQDTAEAPHVDGLGVLSAAQQQFRGAVEPAADVGRQTEAGAGLGEDVTRAAEVTDLHQLTGRVVEDVARLQVPVCDVKAVQVLKHFSEEITEIKM